jgi:hypothetical protein
MNGKGMKKIQKNTDVVDDELLPEYEIDYSKVKRNPYFKKNRTFVEIDEEVAKVFLTSENVNKVLKAIAKSLPKSTAAM